MQNLKDIELIIYLKRSITASLYAPYYSNLDRIVCIYFGVFAVLTLIFCLSWGTKLNKLNQNGTVSERYKAISEEAETKTCFYSVYYLQTNHKHFKSSYLVSLYFFHVFVYGNNSQSTACFMSLTYSRNKKVPNTKDRNTRIFALNIYSKTSIWKVRLKPIYWTIRKSKSRHFSK